MPFRVDFYRCHAILADTRRQLELWLEAALSQDDPEIARVIRAASERLREEMTDALAKAKSYPFGKIDIGEEW